MLDKNFLKTEVINILSNFDNGDEKIILSEVFKVKNLEITFLYIELNTPISFIVEIKDKKDKYYFSEKGFHNVGDKAAIKIKGKKEWWENGKRHRLGFPAVIYKKGRKEWWKNNRLHREDGPAIESETENKFFLFNIELTKEEFDSIEKNDKGQFHSVDKPCFKNDFLELWYKDGKLHREDDYAFFFENKDGGFQRKEMYLNGELSSLVKPAYVNLSLSDGSVLEELWYKDGKLHREDGPAMTLNSNGEYIYFWYYEGLLHKEDGKAISFDDKNYYYFGKSFSNKEDFNFFVLNNELKKTKDKGLKI